MKYPGFLGGSDTRFSRNINAEQTVNWLPELQKANAKSGLALLNTPGVSVFARGRTGPVRAMFAQDGRAFFIASNTLYEVFAGKLVTIRGTVAQDGNPATIHTNGVAGHQLFIVSGGLGYIYDLIADTLTQITDPNFPPAARMGAFIDGYFIALEDDSITFYISDLEDGTNWNGLDVGQVSESSNKIQAMISSHRELWLFGSKTTEVWADSGNASFPFQPISGTFIEQGIIAPFSVVNIDNSIVWVGGNVQGSGVVYRADGYTPKRVSTHAVEFALQGYDTISDAIAWTYQQLGHVFYVLYIPSADTTWVYDTTLPNDIAWHERALWNTAYMRWQPYRGRCHMFAFGKHLIGDRTTGAIYEMSQDLYTESWAI